MMCSYIMFLTSMNPNVRYRATFIITSSTFSFRALYNAYVTTNVVSNSTRSSVISTNVMFSNISSLIST
jgi:hypothetical protein